MDAETVYQVAKALPQKEQKRLYQKLKTDFTSIAHLSKNKKRKILSKEEAQEYLLKHVFNIGN